ncbi:MAG: hypothetical protein QE263_07210 [Vampirovibrionales bacterium]|nr:hypothetical protein [Vampirovibrionales bacterium]
MNVFWMLLRSLLLQRQQLGQQAQTLKNRVIVYQVASAPKAQGIVEYSGALVVAGILAVAIISQVNPSLGPWFISLLEAVSTSVQQWL